MLLSLVFLLACGPEPLCGSREPAGAFLMHWTELNVTLSDTRQVCRATYNHASVAERATSFPTVVAEWDGRLASLGYQPIEHVENLEQPNVVHRTYLRMEQYEARVTSANYVNAVEDRDTVLIELAFEPYIAWEQYDSPSYLAETAAAARPLLSQAWSVVRDRDPAATVPCPESQIGGVTYDWHRLALRHGADIPSPAPDLSSGAVVLRGRGEPGSAMAQRTEANFNRALVQRPIFVARALTYRAPRRFGGTEEFSAGSVRGVVYVVSGDTLVCQVPFAAESSSGVRAGQEVHDLEAQVARAILGALIVTDL